MPYFLEIKELATRANLSEKYFYPASIKIENEAVATRKVFVRRERSQKFHQFKNCAIKGKRRLAEV